MRLVRIFSLGVVLGSANCGGRTSLEIDTLNNGGMPSTGGTAAAGGAPANGGVRSVAGGSSSAGRVSTAGQPSFGGSGGNAGACAWSFAPRGGYVVGSIPGDVVTGDFDGDGFLDLAVSAGNDIRISFNRKDGTFSPPLAVPGGEVPVSLTPGDFNGDGSLDLATVTNVDGTSAVSLLFNRGDGSFRAPITFPAGRTPNLVSVGDLDRDGSLDLAVTNYGSISIFLNRGDGTFLPQTIYEAAGCLNFALGDFDGNGSLDIAATNLFDGTVAILFNQGTGTFNPSAIAFAAGNAAFGIAPADFNGDGALDLAISHDDTSIANAEGQTVAVLLKRAADLDADGRPDLVVPNEHDNTLSVLLNRGDGSFLPQAVYATGRLPERTAIGDFDHDGQLDLAVNNWADLSIGLFFGSCH